MLAKIFKYDIINVSGKTPKKKRQWLVIYHILKRFGGRMNINNTLSFLDLRATPGGGLIIEFGPRSLAGINEGGAVMNGNSPSIEVVAPAAPAEDGFDNSSVTELESNPVVSEEWRKVPNHPRFIVSSTGQVHMIRKKKRGRNFSNTRQVPVYVNNSGYLVVNLQGDHGSRTWGVSQVVAMAFHGQCPEGMQVAHLNGDRLDNRSLNLGFVPPRENAYHRCLHGNTGRKLQREDVFGIYADYDRGIPIKVLAQRHGVSVGHIWNIVQGKSWGPLHRGMGRADSAQP
jgi:hypothetical protein